MENTSKSLFEKVVAQFEGTPRYRKFLLNYEKSIVDYENAINGDTNASSVRAAERIKKEKIQIANELHRTSPLEDENSPEYRVDNGRVLFLRVKR